MIRRSISARTFKFRQVQTSYDIIESPMSIELLKKRSGVNSNCQNYNFTVLNIGTKLIGVVQTRTVQLV